MLAQVRYLEQWTSDSLNATHATCSWAYDKHSHYFVAVRRDVGTVKCSPVLGCSRQTLHPRLYSEC
jgi:hypothetical protein